ncbi:MAG TPA: phosphopantetheine-binding protein [Longimicrobium sp.]|nr:phosphopantetheine-binding protein [Longimicrobium sp.]
MTSADALLTEEEFIRRARRFLHEIGGVDTSALDVDANLLRAGVLDSLLLVAFLAFVEEQRGSEVHIGPEQIGLLTTLRGAWSLVRPVPAAQDA